MLKRIEFYENPRNECGIGTPTAIGRRADPISYAARSCRFIQSEPPQRRTLGAGVSGAWRRRLESQAGRPPTLSPAEERDVLRWFLRSPREFGFSTDLWSAAIVAKLIRRTFHKSFHTRYLNQWLACRRVTSQKPERQAREQDKREVRRWLREEWPRIKNLRGIGVPTWF